MSAANKMRDADTATRSRISPKREIFELHKPDTTLFTTIDGLVKQTGEPAHRLRRLMCKELTDNALDAADLAGSRGQVSIEKRGAETYVVTDPGDGFDRSPDELAALFTVHRTMVSTKYVRRPQRGALGNGLRVVVGCVVVAQGTIEIITLGKRVVLRPRRVGPTEIVSVSDAPEAIGTTLIITLGPTFPDDASDDDLSLARAAIDFAEYADGPPYAREPSPRWIDADAFTEALMLIEPDTVTVRQFVEMFDGCTGVKAGKLAAPFDKNRLARSMSEDEAVALLASMQAAAREVKHTALCLVGHAAYDPECYDYAHTSGTFSYGQNTPRAEIPLVVEAWVSARTRKGRSVEIEQVFGNRSPIVGDTVSAQRGIYYGAKRLTLAGCGLDGFGFDDWPLGDFTAALHIISPFIPLLSIGKRPNLRPFLPAIETALRRAFIKSRKWLPPEIAEPKAPPPPKPPRQPKVEPLPKPPRQVYQPQGVLGRLVAAEAAAAGLHINDLRVMSVKRDPYFIDTVSNHRIGQWFADQVARFVAADVTVHLRGLHYLLCSTAIVRPDGKPYINDHACWNWLQDHASKAARWLKYVDPDRIHDARNEDPIWRARSAYEVSGAPSSGERKIGVDAGSIEAEMPDLDDLLPRLTISGSKRPSQPYRLGLIGEKSSLRPVVEPLARQCSIDVVLDTGDASDSHLYQMAKRASADERPFVVFYLSDFDPGGHNMPTSVARKFQALRDLHFPNLDLRLYPVALTLEQVVEYDLPSAPLRPSEKRKAKWQARNGGREQTELDALMALRPGELERILHVAITPFFDATLDHRFDAANALPEGTDAWLKALPQYAAAVEAITSLHETAITAAEELTEAVEQHIRAVRKAVREAEDAPELDPIDITPEIVDEPPAPMFHTLDDFITATRKLITRRDGSEGGDDDNDDSEGGAP